MAENANSPDNSVVFFDVTLGGEPSEEYVLSHNLGFLAYRDYVSHLILLIFLN